MSSNPDNGPTSSKTKPLGLFVFALMTFSIITSMANTPSIAEQGLSSVTFFLIGAVTFLIPTGLVSAELATGWPQEGGVYRWVSEAFGQRIGFIAIFLQWGSIVIALPAWVSFIGATAVFSIDPGLAQNPFFAFATIVVIWWAATLFNFLGIKETGRITTLGAFFSLFIPAAVLIGFGIAYVVGGHHSQIFLGGTVDRERRVELTHDLGGGFEPDTFDDVALDVHSQDRVGVGVRLVGVGGDLDAARLTASADLHLGFDGDGTAELHGDRPRLFGRIGDASRRGGHAVCGEKFLALVFEEIHLASVMGCRFESVFRRRRQRRAFSLRSSSLARSHRQISPIWAPGVKMRSTPIRRSASTSASGMIPPPNTTTSSSSASPRPSSMAGNNVMWAPDSSERPTASASSCNTASTIWPGVWWTPV